MQAPDRAPACTFDRSCNAWPRSEDHSWWLHSKEIRETDQEIRRFEAFIGFSCFFLSAPQLGEKHERQSSWPMASAISLPSLPYATETVGYFLPKPSQNLHSLDQESCTLLKFTGPATHPEVSTHLLINFPGKISNLNKGYVVVCRMFLDVLGAMLASLVGGHHKKCHSADWQQQNT